MHSFYPIIPRAHKAEQNIYKSCLNLHKLTKGIITLFTALLALKHIIYYIKCAEPTPALLPQFFHFTDLILCKNSYSCL